ncbi:MAG: alpha/beta hydrolase [Candidatus Sericytochromatia bacterium]
MQILGLLIVTIPLLAWLYVYDLAGRVIFFKYGPERWAVQRPGICSPARREQVFADMRPGAKADTALELSCDLARRQPATSAYALTSDGLKIHYRVFAATAKQQPILLHVPGITSTWLDGARYVPLAKRLGFQLAVLELRNHGISGNNGQGASYGCREKEDVLAVVKALQQRFPGRPMLIWSSSMGSMSVLNAAQQLQAQVPAVKALLLENPPTALREAVEKLAKDKQPALLYEAVTSMASLRSGVDFRTCSPVAVGAGLTIPALVTVARADSLTPVPMVQKLFAALPAGHDHQLKIYPYGKHAAIWNGQPKVYEADIKAFWQAHSH